MNAETPPSFFISYKSEDVDFVRPLCERLLAEGYPPSSRLASQLFPRKQGHSDFSERLQKPLVVGSGNDAAVMGRILLEKADAVFADESTTGERKKAE
jgi:hypothetical protein